MLVRNLRLTALLWELEDFRKIAATFDRFSKPFLTIMFSLYTVMFFYAIIGEFFFEGVITDTEAEDSLFSSITSNQPNLLSRVD